MSDQVPTNDVQPTEGQGAADTGSGLYDLSSVPEHLRATVEPIFKQWDANVTRKFQEHSEFRKGYEPYEQLGIRDVDPEELRELLEFRQIASDQDAFKAWYEEIGKELGLAPGAVSQAGDDLGDEDLGDEPSGSNIQDLVAQAVQQALQPIMQEREQAQQEANVQRELEAISNELSALEKEHGKFNRERVTQLAMAYGDDPEGIKKAFADYQDLVKEAQRGFVERGLDQPDTPNQGGSPLSQVSAPKTFNDARDAAIALLRNSATASST